ncbi:Uncharacterised protein [Paenibacillus thiaminolyticus]|nr:Uncharacterised protein [Paenibacillus thiaminolyticus]
MMMIFAQNFMLAFGISICVSVVASISHHPKPEYRFGLHDIKHSFLLVLPLSILFTIPDILFFR